MPVVMLLAVAAVLVSVFFVATGRGGEMSYERPDQAPLDLGPVSATDIALMRPPTALWGYNMQVTDEALELIARAMRDRDVAITALQQQLAALNPKAARPVQPPGPRQPPEATEPLPASDVRLPPYLGQPPESHHTGPPSTQGQLPELDDFPEFAPQSEPGQRPQTPPAAQSAGVPATVESPQSVGVPATVESPQPAGVPATVESPQPADAAPTRNFLRATPKVTPPLSAPVPSARADTPGPQGAYDAHGWWAEQRAAHESQAGQVADDPSCDVDPPADSNGDGNSNGNGNGDGPAAAPDNETLAAAEEQSW